MQILFIKNNELVELTPDLPSELDALTSLVDSLGELFETTQTSGVIVVDIEANSGEPDLPIMSRYLLVDHLLAQLGADVRHKGEHSCIRTARSYALVAYNAFKARVEQRPSEG